MPQENCSDHRHNTNAAWEVVKGDEQWSRITTLAVLRPPFSTQEVSTACLISEETNSMKTPQHFAYTYKSLCVVLLSKTSWRCRNCSAGPLGSRRHAGLAQTSFYATFEAFMLCFIFMHSLSISQARECSIWAFWAKLCPHLHPCNSWPWETNKSANKPSFKVSLLKKKTTKTNRRILQQTKHSQSSNTELSLKLWAHLLW